jgi:beta-N-acetylhexosaminidase
MSAQVGAIEMVIEAVKSGELSQESIEASVVRVEELKTKYLSSKNNLSNERPVDKSAQEKMASEIYAQSTTLVRSDPGIFPISKDPSAKIAFISPGKTPLGGGAVESGEQKTREPYTPEAYIDILRAQNPSILDLRFDESKSNWTSDCDKAIAEAETIIFASRNASLSQYQKDFGLYLGSKYGKKLIVIATCDPYDFQEENLPSQIRNYVTIYEPTIPAFKSAVDIIFGITKPLGVSPVGSIISDPHKTLGRGFNGTDEEIKHIWKLWQVIFPAWPIKYERLSKILQNESGHHFVHDHGFCLSFIQGGQGKVSCVGVLEQYREKGIGTRLIELACLGLRKKGKEAGLGDMIPIQIASVFPRLWAGVPLSFPKQHRDFFLHRGLFTKIPPAFC